MEYEQGAGEVEYVSDEVESDEEDDLSDLEDWLGDDQTSPASEQDDDSEEDSEEDSEDEEEAARIKKAMGDLKRKRPTGGKPKPVKKSSKDKPKREIEYEREPAQRAMLTV
jgi:protein MAK16